MKQNNKINNHRKANVLAWWLLMSIPAGFLGGIWSGIWNGFIGKDVLSGMIGGFLGISVSFTIIGLIENRRIKTHGNKKGSLCH